MLALGKGAVRANGTRAVVLFSEQQSTNRIQGLDKLSLAILLLHEHIRSIESRGDLL